MTKQIIPLLFCLLFTCELPAQFGVSTEKLLEREDYSGWLRKWRRKLPFNTKQLAQFRQESQELLTRLKSKAEEAVAKCNSDIARQVAEQLPSVFGGVIQLDAQFEIFAARLPQLNGLRSLTARAPCLPSLAASCHHLQSGNYEAAIAKAQDHCAADYPEYDAHLEDAIYTALDALSAAVTEALEERDYFTAATRLQKLDALIRDRQLLPAQVERLPPAAGSFADYNGQLREKTVAALLAITENELQAGAFFKAQSACDQALLLAKGAHRETLLQLRDTILKQGVQSFVDCAERARVQHQYGAARDCLQKAHQLDERFVLQPALAVVDDSERRYTGEQLFRRARKAWESSAKLETHRLAQEALAYMDTPELREFADLVKRVLLADYANCRREALAREDYATARTCLESANAIDPNIDLQDGYQRITAYRDSVDCARTWERAHQEWRLGNKRQALNLVKKVETCSSLDQQQVGIFKTDIKESIAGDFVREAQQAYQAKDCLTAMRALDSARHFSPHGLEINRMRKLVRPCAEKKVAIIFLNESNFGISHDFQERMQNRIRESLHNALQQLEGGRYARIIHEEFVDRVNSRSPATIARSVGADYALVIPLFDYRYSSYRDPGNAISACTSTSRREFISPYHYIELLSYRPTTVMEHKDRASASLSIRSYLLRVKQGTTVEVGLTAVSERWDQTSWRSDTDAQYLRECPNCNILTDLTIRTKFLPAHMFTKNRSIPSGYSLISDKLLQALGQFTKKQAQLINQLMWIDR